MDYMSARDASEKWGISQRHLNALCSKRIISDSKKIDDIWFIPITADRPLYFETLFGSGVSKVKPFLKWAGGKGQLLDIIRKYYPKELGKTINKYAEPFIGGGAVLFDILGTCNIEYVYISDKNAELINVYKRLQDDSELLISMLKNFQEEYHRLDEEHRKIFYHKKRNRYNILKKAEQRDIELAALFIFLNRTCFNGLYRVNAKGEFNVPMGAYKFPTICDENNLRKVSEALQGVIIKNADYKASETFIDQNTFVYFDPPYRPLTKTASFTSYTENDFNDDNQIELSEYAKNLSNKGAYVLLSNSDPKNANPGDNFFDDLYAGMSVNRIYASRMINSKASNRGKISELLICSTKEGFYE